ncbi:phosphoglycerate mutase family protein [Tritrichomonas foetus]|uniref:Phosphoglycerate mutase family protein n=1 Tax=Tritrichomonas foetus TaxID=1144522 RepID=A0A1J4JD84_9EUKA|nr:phosphoglycerate mutase family protein [Tritrichomonas foetus]|eukprot:OHS97114.1 phosphoglycerate mutase family protein [Tritrichomonas foetus]
MTDWTQSIKSLSNHSLREKLENLRQQGKDDQNTDNLSEKEQFSILRNLANKIPSSENQSLTRILLVRHGESVSNAGLSSPVLYNEIPLTKDGVEQAKNFAVHFNPDNYNSTPSLIISSTFTRAIQTSIPFRERFKDTPFKTDDRIHEFQFLDPESCKNTTLEMRKSRVKHFWEICDPDYKDSEKSESFGDFVNRAKDFYENIFTETKGHSLVVIFTHGNFIKLIKMINERPNESSKKLMEEFPKQEDIPNLSILELHTKM